MELDGVGRYELHGEGRPVLILSNPQAGPRWWTAPFVSALVSAGYEAIAFIHTGESSGPEHVVGDVATLVKHLGRGPDRLLGWSQGAAIAQEVALARPDVVAAAALIATYGRQNSFDRLAQQAWAALEGGGETLDPLRLALLLLTSYPPHALGEDSFVASASRGCGSGLPGPSGSLRPGGYRRPSSPPTRTASRRWPRSRCPASWWASPSTPTPSLPGRGRWPRPSRAAATRSCPMLAT
jgi:pimeloyl-ACP methyl ester carboxylesterase